MEGWIKLHRQLIESEIFASSKGLKIWIWLLLKVQFENKFIPIKIGAGESVVTLNRGQLIFGRHKAEDELGIDGSTVYKWLQKLEILGMIKLQSNNHYTIITIDNFDKYNEKSSSRVTTEGTPEEHHVTTEGTPRNTYKKVKNDNNVEERKEQTALSRELLESIKKYFGFVSQLNDYNKWKRISSFLTLLETEGKLEYFKTKFEFYKIFKELSKQEIHGFEGFLDGGWDAENWEHKLSGFKKTKANNSNAMEADMESDYAKNLLRIK